MPEKAFSVCIKDSVFIDPACGSGFLLLKAAKALGKDAVRQGFYGQEIKNAKSVEITCYDNHGSSDAVEIYTITDEKEVNSICNTFSLLVLKKVKITKPTMMSYSVRFLDDSGNTIETVNLLYGYNVIQCDGFSRGVTLWLSFIW